MATFTSGRKAAYARLVSDRDPYFQIEYERSNRLALGMGLAILGAVVGAVIGLFIGRRTPPAYLTPDFTPVVDAAYGGLLGAAAGLVVFAVWTLWRRRGRSVPPMDP